MANDTLPLTGALPEAKPGADGATGATGATGPAGPPGPDVTAASFVTTASEAGLSAEKVLGTDIIIAGTLAARPAAALNGRLYFATDDNGGTLYRDTGAAWVKVGVADHSALANVTADQHHAQAHTLASHSTKAHSELTGVGANDHHAQAHGASVHSGIIPTAKVRRSTADGAQAIANATWTFVNFPTEDEDNDAIHDPATNNERLTCKTAGLYLVGGYCKFDPNATGTRFGLIEKNAATAAAGTFLAQNNVNTVTEAGVSPWLFLTLITRLAVNDWLTFDVRQTSGASLNLMALDAFTPVFWIIWMTS